MSPKRSPLSVCTTTRAGVVRPPGIACREREEGGYLEEFPNELPVSEYIDTVGLRGRLLGSAVRFKERFPGGGGPLLTGSRTVPSSVDEKILSGFPTGS